MGGTVKDWKNWSFGKEEALCSGGRGGGNGNGPVHISQNGQYYTCAVRVK